MGMTVEEFVEQHRTLEQFIAEINECRVGYAEGHRDALVRMSASAANLSKVADALANSGWVNRP